MLKREVCLRALVAHLVLSGCVLAATPETMPATADQIQMELIVDNGGSTEILQGEPLPVVVAVRNNSSKSVIVPAGLVFDAEVVAAEKGHTGFVRCRAAAIDAFWNTRVLAPHEAFGTLVILRVGLSDDLKTRKMFPVAGKFELWARVSEGNLKLESATVGMTVIETPKEELDALKLSEALEKPVTAESIKSLQELVERFPKSAFADVSNRSLARNFDGLSSKKSGRDREVAKQAFMYYAAISNRHRAIKLHAMVNQGYLLQELPDLVSGDVRARYFRELAAVDAMEEILGLKRQLDSFRSSLKPQP